MYVTNTVGGVFSTAMTASAIFFGNSASVDSGCSFPSLFDSLVTTFPGLIL